jgi:hypothetical protein
MCGIAKGFYSTIALVVPAAAKTWVQRIGEMCGCKGGSQAEQQASLSVMNVY